MICSNWSKKKEKIEDQRQNFRERKWLKEITWSEGEPRAAHLKYECLKIFEGFLVKIRHTM